MNARSVRAQPERQVGEPDKTARVLVVQPDPGDPLDRFESLLHRRHIELDVVRPYDGDLVPREVGADGLIVLGGRMGAADDAALPWLEEVRALLRAYVSQGVPTLGICLGGQLLAEALGGKVAQGALGFESGLISVETSAACASDVLLGGLGQAFPAASMHQDAIDELPPGAVLLGSTADYPNQAFRAAPHAWGVQFHPEISASTYASWADKFEHQDAHQVRRVAAGVEPLRTADPQLLSVSTEIAERFASLVMEFSGSVCPT